MNKENFTSAGSNSALVNFSLFIQNVLLLLYISGNETKDASQAHLCTVALKLEETCKQGRLLCEPETPG